MVKIERIDYEDSFMTTLVFTNGNKGQEIQVYTWEADNIETALKTLSLEVVMGYYNKVGKTLVKEWV
jgi:anthranilate/para-aminobenzoate synthase component II